MDDQENGSGWSAGGSRSDDCYRREIEALRSDNARLRAERDEAIGERDALIAGWPRRADDCVRMRMRDRKWVVGECEDELFDSREEAVRLLVFGTPPCEGRPEGLAP